MFDHIWSFRTARFRVALEAEHERDIDLSWDDTGETAEKLESGEWTCFCFRVAVYCDGRMIAADYLGNSIYADPLDFYREHVGFRNNYFGGMVREAIAGARHHLASLPKLRHVA